MGKKPAKVTLVSSDGESFPVQRRLVLKASEYLKAKIEALHPNEPKVLKINDVTGPILKLVIEWMNFTKCEENSAGIDFLARTPFGRYSALAWAAHYMEIPVLTKIIADKIGPNVPGNTVKGLSAMLNAMHVEDTPELVNMTEDEIRTQNQFQERMGFLVMPILK